LHVQGGKKRLTYGKKLFMQLEKNLDEEEEEECFYMEL
jgi:hypothetical protein